MPGNPVHRYHLGAALQKSGNQAAGRKELETSLQISGNFDGAVKARALLAEKN
jgi:cytoskeletal protein CcmA (bactofilin family)